MRSDFSAKKTPLRLLALLLTLLLLCGCAAGGQQESAAPSGGPESSAADGTAAPDSRNETAAPETDGTKPVISEEEIAAAVDAAPVSSGRCQREGTHSALYAVHSLSVEPFTLREENRIYDEADLRGAARTVWSDLAAAEAVTGSKPEPVEFFLLNRLPEGVPANEGRQVCCTPADLESGAYREALLAAAYDLGAGWQAVGLTEYVFGAGDDESLRTYYADGSRALTASCSAVHLSPLLSNAETARAARNTARSMAAFLLETEGFSAFCQATDPAAVLPAWREHMGIAAPLTLPEKSAEAARLKLELDSDRLCVLRLDNFTVELYEDSWLLDPDGIYAWFCDFCAGMDMVLDQIRAEAPSAAATAEEKFAEPIRILFENENTMSYCYPFWNEIHLSRPDGIWHETVHLLLEEPLGNSGLNWEREAAAEHFSYAATSRYAPVRYISDGFDAYLDFFAEADLQHRAAAEGDLVFHGSVWNLYQELRDPAVTEYDDVGAYCRAYGISALLLAGRIERTQTRYRLDRSIADGEGLTAGTKEADGSALSYPEAVALFEYLAETQGMDEVVSAYLNGRNTEKAFGIPYSELFAAAKAHYEALWGDKLALD